MYILLMPTFSQQSPNTIFLVKTNYRVIGGDYDNINLQFI